MMNLARLATFKKLWTTQNKVQTQGTIPPLISYIVVSSTGTYDYNLAKFFCSLLSPHIPYDYSVTDSSFVEEIQNLSIHHKFMVSFDVESLFTNILLNESIQVAIDYITKLTTNELGGNIFYSNITISFVI